MKAFILSSALFFSALSLFCQTNNDSNFIFLGNVDCRTREHYLDSTQKVYNASYVDEAINQSKQLIDINLREAGYPFLEIIDARFYWDTTFKLYYFRYKLQEDGNYSKDDTIYPPSNMSIDSLFTKLVEAGLFSLPLISTADIKKTWKAAYTSKQGVFGENYMSVADGLEYVLTYKVNNCYGQYFFNNPASYLKCYVDNPIFKRQDAIVRTIMNGYYLRDRHTTK